MYQIHLCLIKCNLHNSLYFIWLPVEKFAEAIWIELGLNSWSGIQPGHSCYNCYNFLKIMPHCWHYPSFSSYCSCLQELLPSSCVYRRKRHSDFGHKGVELTCVWWQGRRKLYANYKGKRGKTMRSQNRCHLPIGFPKPPSPPAERTQCPGIKGEPDPAGGAQRYWGVLTHPHTAMCAISFEPMSHSAARCSPCSG